LAKKKTTKLYSIKTHNTNSTKKIHFLQKSLPPFLSLPFQRTKRNPNSRVSELKKPKKKPTFGTRRAALCLAAAAVATVAISPPRPPTPLQNPQLQNFTTSKSRGTTPTTNHGKKTNKRDENVESRILNPKP
jgi:hypothetical protein